MVCSVQNQYSVNTNERYRYAKATNWFNIYVIYIASLDGQTNDTTTSAEYSKNYLNMYWTDSFQKF